MNPKTLLTLLLATNSHLLIPGFTNAATLESISDNPQLERAKMQIEIREVNKINSRETILSNRDNQDFNKDYNQDQNRDQGRGRGRRRR